MMHINNHPTHAISGYTTPWPDNILSYPDLPLSTQVTSSARLTLIDHCSAATSPAQTHKAPEIAREQSSD